MEETAVQTTTQWLTSQAAAICGDVGRAGYATSSATPCGSCTTLCHGADFEPTHVFASD